MSSREIAKLTGKQHQHVMRDIRIMLSQIFGEEENNYAPEKLLINQQRPDLDAVYSVRASSKNNSGKISHEYLLNKDLTFTLITGYDAKPRYRIIQRWQFLESQQHKTPEEFRLEEIFKLLYSPVNLMSFEQISLSERLAQRKFTWTEFQEFFGMKNNTYFLRVVVGIINRQVLGMSAGNFRRQVLGPQRVRIVNGELTRFDVDTNNLPHNLTKDFLPKPHQECVQRIMQDLLEYFTVRPQWTQESVKTKVLEIITTRKGNIEILIGRDLHELVLECIQQISDYSRIHDTSPYEVIQNNLIQLNYDQLALEREIRKLHFQP
jgi:phage regulator Rha-like protein